MFKDSWLLALSIACLGALALTGLVFIIVALT